MYVEDVGFGAQRCIFGITTRTFCASSGVSVTDHELSGKTATELKIVSITAEMIQWCRVASVVLERLDVRGLCSTRFARGGRLTLRWGRPWRRLV